MKINHVRAKLKRGEPSIGSWLSLADPTAAHMMARTGFDWLSVNLEHAPIGVESMAVGFGLMAGQNCCPLARVLSNTAENIKQVLDNGGWGVIVPMVNSHAEARAAVAASRYFPVGERSVGGSLHAINFDTDPATYFDHSNEQTLVVVQMEHVKAIENAEEILSVPGIDAFFIGPNDLLSSMGQKPVFESDYPPFVNALQHLVTVAKKYGVAPGIHVATAEAAKRRIAEGFQFIAVSSEAGMMLTKAKEITTTLGIGTNKVVAKY